MAPVTTNAWNRLRYTLYAPLYDHVVRFAKPRRRSIELLALRPGARVLIVGAGTGADLPFLPDHVEVTATDLTPAMVERIRARARRLGRVVDACVMDAQALDCANESFDAVLLHLIVAVAPDPRAVMREADRVLVPGGRVAVFDKFASEGRTPSRLRRLANVATNLLFTDITRKLGPLLEGTRLRIVHREPAVLGRAFEIALLEKV